MTTKQLSSYGLSCFDLQLKPLEKLLKKSTGAKNPGAYLYENGARNFLFRLEALTRIYRTFHDKKFFDALHDDYKAIEDLLGKIDYYDGFLHEFSSVKKLPSSFLKFFKSGVSSSISLLNKKMPEYTWANSASSIKNTRARLQKAEWLESKKERKEICKFLIKVIDKITSQYENGRFNFDDLEDGIHSFRRKLRWISIYASSLNGIVQLKKVKLMDQSMKKYLTTDVVKSPFNVFPKPQRGMNPIYIHSQNFYALSWMINELGKLKDQGLKIEIIKQATSESGIHAPEKKKNITNLLLAKDSPKQNEISSRVEILADEFLYKQKVLEKIKRDIFRSMK